MQMKYGINDADPNWILSFTKSSEAKWSNEMDELMNGYFTSGIDLLGALFYGRAPDISIEGFNFEIMKMGSLGHILTSNYLMLDKQRNVDGWMNDVGCYPHRKVQRDFIVDNHEQQRLKNFSIERDSLPDTVYQTLQSNLPMAKSEWKRLQHDDKQTIILEELSVFEYEGINEEVETHADYLRHHRAARDQWKAKMIQQL